MLPPWYYYRIMHPSSIAWWHDMYIPCDQFPMDRCSPPSAIHPTIIKVHISNFLNNTTFSGPLLLGKLTPTIEQQKFDESPLGQLPLKDNKTPPPPLNRSHPACIHLPTNICIYMNAQLPTNAHSCMVMIVSVNITLLFDPALRWQNFWAFNYT